MIAVTCGRHNQESAEVLTGHLYAGQLNNDKLEKVRILPINDIKLRYVLVEINMKNKLNVSDSRSIYNTCNKFRKQERENLSIMQYTLKFAADDRYHHFYTQDERTNRVNFGPILSLLIF